MDENNRFWLIVSVVILLSGFARLAYMRRHAATDLKLAGKPRGREESKAAGNVHLGYVAVVLSFIFGTAGILYAFAGGFINRGESTLGTVDSTPPSPTASAEAVVGAAETGNLGVFAFVIVLVVTGFVQLILQLVALRMRASGRTFYRGFKAGSITEWRFWWGPALFWILAIVFTIFLILR